MRLFPHETGGGVEIALLNIVSPETAVCGICDNVIEFDQNDLNELPENLANGENLAADIKSLRNNDIGFTIHKDPATEEYISQNQEGDKQKLLSSLAAMEKLIRTLAGRMSEIFFDPFVITPDISLVLPTYQAEEFWGVKKEDLTDKQIELFNHPIITIDSADKYPEPKQVLTWVVDGQDIRDKIKFAPHNHYALFGGPIKEAINKTFIERFRYEFNLLHGQEIFDQYKEIIPIIQSVSMIDPFTFEGIGMTINSIESWRAHNIITKGVVTRYLGLADSIGKLRRTINEDPKLQIVTKVKSNSISGTPQRTKRLMPVCLECAETFISRCSDCDKPGYDTDFSSMGDKKLCSSCQEDYSTCDDCNKFISNDDANWVESEGKTYCNACYNESHKRVDPTDFYQPKYKSKNDLFFLGGGAKGNLPKLLAAVETLEEKTLHQDSAKDTGKFFTAVVNLFKANGYNEKDANDILNALHNTTTIFPITSSSQTTISSGQAKFYLKSLADSIRDYLDEQAAFYDKFPLQIEESGTNIPVSNIFTGKKLELLKNYAPLPVSYEFDESSDSHSGSNFVVKMIPNQLLIRQSEELFPNIGEKAWDYISETGTHHYPGSIAYARIGSRENYFVIDNFQRDSDIQNVRMPTWLSKYPIEDQDTAEKAIRWWDKRLSKWYIQFAEWLINFAKVNEKELYLTNFKTQQRKWTSIPERSREIYDSLPEELASAAFYKKLKELRKTNPEETEESLKEKVKLRQEKIYPSNESWIEESVKVEGLDKPVGGIWRLAKDYTILGLFKIASGN